MQHHIQTVEVTETPKTSFEEMISRENELKERTEHYMRELITISGGNIQKVEQLMGAALLSIGTITVLFKHSSQQYGADRFKELYEATRKEQNA